MLAVPASGRKSYTVHNPRSLGTDDEKTGWHFEETGKVGVRWTCDYGCKSFYGRKPPGRYDFHTPDCKYWQREGRDGRSILRPGSRVAIGAPWTCVYGCTPFIWGGADFPGQYHRWDCEYWNREGSTDTPFDNRRVDADRDVV
ncbi:MAG: hypothetical protein ACREJC_15155 [Tepidisphaeraceae bacterium]